MPQETLSKIELNCLECPHPECISPCPIEKKVLADRRRIYYAQNRGKIDEKNRIYYAQNREKHAKVQREYYTKNREKILAGKKQAYAKKQGQPID